MRAMVLGLGLAACLVARPGRAAELTVMISGGFAAPYGEVLPAFERQTGLKVTTLSGASQGSGPKTVKSQLAGGADVDVVILNRTGLDDLKAAGLIADGPDRDLATTMLAAAVRQGRPKPDISTMDGLKQALLSAPRITMPASTSGVFMRDEVLPKLGIAEKVSLSFVPRGRDSTEMVAAGTSDLAIGAASELVGQPGIETIGPLPREAQLKVVLAGAVVKASHRQADARKLLAFLSSEAAAPAIKRAAMDPVGPPP